MGEHTGEVIIEVRDACKSFSHGRIRALQGVSFDVHRGEVLVIIGPSGSGKSTMLRSINRLEAIDSGSIVVDGIPLTGEKTNINKVREEVGMVFQQFNLFPHLTVLGNLTLAPIKVGKIDRSKADDRARQLLARVGIPEKSTAYPGQLSGGQQQRVAIARALAMNPRMMEEISDAFREILKDKEVARVVARRNRARRGLTKSGRKMRGLI